MKDTLLPVAHVFALVMMVFAVTMLAPLVTAIWGLDPALWSFVISAGAQVVLKAPQRALVCRGQTSLRADIGGEMPCSEPLIFIVLY